MKNTFKTIAVVVLVCGSVHAQTVLDWGASNWNSGSGWTDNTGVGVMQAWNDVEGTGINVTAGQTGTLAAGGPPGPHIFDSSESFPGEDVLRMTGSKNASPAVFEVNFSNEVHISSVRFGGPRLRDDKSYATGLEIRAYDASGAILISPSSVSVSSGGSSIAPLVSTSGGVSIMYPDPSGIQTTTRDYYSDFDFGLSGVAKIEMTLILWDQVVIEHPLFDPFSAAQRNNARHDQSAYMSSITFTPVPEPSAAILLGIGGMMLILRRRK